MLLYVSVEFDAVLIAGKLRLIADSLNDKGVYREALNEFKKEAAKGVSGLLLLVKLFARLVNCNFF